MRWSVTTMAIIWIHIFGGFNYDFPTDAYTYDKIEAGMALQRGKQLWISYKSTDKLIGLFARVGYNYDDRYLFYVSLRREGSSSLE